MRPDGSSGLYYSFNLSTPFDNTSNLTSLINNATKGTGYGNLSPNYVDGAMLANDDEAVREWLVEAEKLVESFRETRALFLTSRVRVPPVIVDDYAQLWLVAPWV